MHKRTSLLVVVVLFLCRVVSAQSILGLHFPMGMPASGAAGPSLSLGGAGVAVENDFLGLTGNPANLGLSGRTTFSTAVSGDVITLEDKNGATKHYDANLRMFSLTIPMGRLGALGCSFEPYSSAASRFALEEAIDVDELLADTAELGVLQSGGAMSWQIGWGYSVKKLLRVGIAYSYFNFNRFLALSRETRGSLNDRSVDSTSVRFSTSGVRAGVQVPLGKVTVGLRGDYYFMNSASTSRVLTGTRDTSDIMKGSRSIDFKPPPALFGGLSWQINPQWLAALDAGVVMWDRFYSEEASVRPLRNAMRACGGVQFIPAPDLLTPKLHEVIQYRVGMRYAQLPAEETTEMAANFGLGLPMQSKGGLFDIIFEYARRSDARSDDYHENLFSLKLGINGGRKWYQSSSESY